MFNDISEFSLKKAAAAAGNKIDVSSVVQVAGHYGLKEVQMLSKA